MSKKASMIRASKKIGILKVGCFLVMGVWISGFESSWAANPAEQVQKAIVTAFEKSSVPLFEDKSNQPKPQTDPFLEKVRKERNKFYYQDQKRQREFVEKLRDSNWSEEKKQQKIADFHKEQTERRQKFGQKLQKKIEKHQEKIRNG